MSELFDWKKYNVIRNVGAKEPVRNDIYDITLATCNEGLVIDGWKSDWLIEHPSKDFFHLRLTSASIDVPSETSKIGVKYHGMEVNQNVFVPRTGGKFDFKFKDLTDYSITKWLTAWQNLCGGPMTQLTYPMRDVNVHVKVRRYDSQRSHIMTYIGFDCTPSFSFSGENDLISDGGEPAESGSCGLTLTAAHSFRVTSPTQAEVGNYW